MLSGSESPRTATMDADVRPPIYRGNDTEPDAAVDPAPADVINHHHLPHPPSPSKVQAVHGSPPRPKSYHAATVAPTLSARPRLVRPSSRRAAAASSGGLRTVIRTGRSPTRLGTTTHQQPAVVAGPRSRPPSPAVTVPVRPESGDGEDVISRVPATSNSDQDAPTEMATVAQLLAEARAQSLLAPADLDRFDAMADKNGLRDLPVDHATWLAMVTAMQHADAPPAPASAPVMATGPVDAPAVPRDQSDLNDDVSQADPDAPLLPTSPSSGGTWVTTSRASLPLADAADLIADSTDAVVDDHHDPTWLSARLDRLPRQAAPTNLGTAPSRTRRGSTSSRTASPTRRASTATTTGRSMPDLLAPDSGDQDPTTPQPPRRAPPPLRRRGTLAGPKPDSLTTSTSDDDIVRRLESQLADRDCTIRTLRDRTRLLAARHDRDAAHLADAEAAAKELADALAAARASAALSRRDALAAVAAEAAAAAERDRAVEALRRLEPQVTAARTARDELRSAVEPLRERVAELEAERAALVEQVEELAAREGELVTQLEACQAELAVAQAVAAEHQHAATLLAGASLADEEEVGHEKLDKEETAGLPMHEQGIDVSLGGSKASLSSAARKRASLCDELESADALFSSSSMARHSRVADTDEQRAQMTARIEELVVAQERSVRTIKDLEVQLDMARRAPPRIDKGEEERAQMAAQIGELVAAQEQNLQTIKALEAQLDMTHHAPPRIVDTGEEERVQVAARIDELVAAQERSAGRIKDLETQLEMAHQVIQHLAATHMAATAATRPGSPTKPTAYSAPPTPVRGLIQARPPATVPPVQPKPIERAPTPPNAPAEPELISATTTPVLGPANGPLTPSVSSSPVLTTITTPTLPPRDQPFAGAWPQLPRRNPLIATASTASLVRPVSPPAEAAHRRLGSVSSSTSSAAPLAATQTTVSVGGGSGASPTDHGVCPAAPAVPTGWRLVPSLVRGTVVLVLLHAMCLVTGSSATAWPDVSQDHTVPVDNDEDVSERSPSPSRIPLVRTPTVRSRASTTTGSVAPVAAVTIAPKRPVVVFQGRLRRLNGWVRVGEVARAAASQQQATDGEEEDDVSLGVDSDDDDGGYESAVESEAPRAVSPVPVRRSRMAWLFGGWWAWY